MLDYVTNWFHSYVDKTIYPVDDVNKTGVHTFDIGGHECIQVTRDDAKCWVIYVHGNGVTLDSLHSARLANKIVGHAKCNVVAPAYPAKLSNGPKYDNQVAACVNDVYQQLVDDTDAPVYIVGRSLGVGIALQACQTVRKKPKGIVCISGFDSIQNRVPARLSMLSCAIGDRFNNIRAIASDHVNNVDTLIIHGRQDQLIPVSCADHLFCATDNATLDIIEDMDHTPTPTQWKMLCLKICNFIDPPEAKSMRAPVYNTWHCPK